MTTTVWIPGDQLLDNHPALTAAMKAGKPVRVLLIESRSRTRKLPYRLQKLALLFSAMRHYTADLESKGIEVDYRRATTFTEGLRQHLADYRPKRLLTMAAASYPGRRFQTELDKLLELPVEVLPNTQFLTGLYDPFPRPQPGKRYVMETFYRAMRRHFGLLMDGDEPTGGRWNFDKENRKSLPRGIRLPPDAIFAADDLTRAALADVGLDEQQWAGYAVTREQALSVYERFVAERLPSFGAYEDAMTTRSHSLFHSLLSPYLNLGLLEPLELARAAEQAHKDGRAPLNSVEGFIRQIVGWREYIYWQYWRQVERSDGSDGWRGRNAWEAAQPMPAFFWTGRTDLACLRHALGRALSTGYNHHIERLMLLSNFLMLTGVHPDEANDWFLSVYVDAYEWVMAPNVYGMGLNADDGLTATKPYIASANYINKMSDHCAGCRFNPKARTGPEACPFNYLYWNFLLLHEHRLRANPRFGPAVLGLRRLGDEERATIRRQATNFLDAQA